jgi:hypothetical protein
MKRSHRLNPTRRIGFCAMWVCINSSSSSSGIEPGLLKARHGRRLYLFINPYVPIVLSNRGGGKSSVFFLDFAYGSLVKFLLFRSKEGSPASIMVQVSCGVFFKQSMAGLGAFFNKVKSMLLCFPGCELCSLKSVLALECCVVVLSSLVNGW